MAYYGNDEDVEQEPEQESSAPLWPSAADGRSGMRDRGIVEPSIHETGPYRLLSPLGTSAYGSAFRALHVEQHRMVALHYLPYEDDPQGSFGRALPLLVAKCAQLTHRNVIALEEHGRDQTSGAYYLVTEPLAGVSLASVLEERGTLPLLRALELTLQMGRALRAAHKFGIVHGALTPASVRVVQGEQGELVRVVGFGALTIAPSEPRRRAPVRVRSAYDAPECLLGVLSGPRSDVFAIAALLYRMLNGAPPRVSEDAPLTQIESVEPIPRELEELLLRCLEPRPEARLADVVSFVRKLREIARSVDVQGASAARRSSPSESSLPPPELPPAEGDASGSLFGGEAFGVRQGAFWILMGLTLALAAVWLLWRASAQGASERPATSERE